ncbi:DUF1634 domain-containing protein [Oculatella sp. FACHB-28]|uniref:DUF1634 domain-containing protein n=1 Tax=Cyanophyceae TaxID=3028117 RepID=UPI001688C416|nr:MULTISPECIES: DUF1634 domain-containing protein [Cyanophyceae]MBD2056096.1 DUF1634 domain-containing protein [Oculatella sp. FACHB-28]MBD2071980.1 DUF1634 domain-containing protein [Leptolyngbya sp. FACHB-671]
MPPESEVQIPTSTVTAQALSIALEHPPVVVDLSVSCQDYPQHQLDERSPDCRLGIILSNLLKYGVWLATAIVLLGGILYLVRHGMEPVNYHIFQGEPDMFRSPAGVIDAVLSGRRRGIVQLGLLFLIATPVLRVLVSFIFFIKQRDIPYVIITGLVISGLLYSLLGAYF